ncbi:MAG TPA: PDZ domain-containing protein [Solirubrobacteraceae bacterium]
MSGPKHLWSGDWENESEDASTQRIREPRPPEPEPEPVTPVPPRPKPRRKARPWVVPVAIAVLVIAAVAFGASKLFDHSHTIPSTASALNPLPPPRITGNTRPITWLGMEIVTSTQGNPVVETVRPNSNGDRAGVEPGDTILLVNNHGVGSTGSISDAIKGLHSGDRITMVVNTGGADLTLDATLAAAPARYP